MSPFDNPLNAAFMAMYCAHFFMMLNRRVSPLRSFIQQISQLNDLQWDELRRPWGICLLVAAQVMGFIGLINCSEEPLMFAPLLALTASVPLHLSVLRNSLKIRNLAIGQFIAALHAEFIIDSYLQTEHIIWALLLIWAGCLASHHYLKNKLSLLTLQKYCSCLALLILLHILYLTPQSASALWAMAIMTILTLLTPFVSRDRTLLIEDKVLGAIILLIPTYLCYFSIYEQPGAFHFIKEPFPLSLFTLFITGLAVHYFHCFYRNRAFRNEHSPRIFHLLLNWLCLDGPKIYKSLLCVCSIGVLLCLPAFAESAFSNVDFGALLLVCGGLSVCWMKRGNESLEMKSYIMMILSGLLFFIIIRRQIELVTGLWRNEYDVWCSLLISLLITGAKPLFQQMSRELRLPLISCLFIIPLTGLAWSLYHGLGSDTTLLIIGLHSLMFTFLGKDDKKSPYNFAAILGFSAFTIIFLWSKLHLRTLHVYVIPAGIGILILVQLFNDKIEESMRRRIRMVTLLCMVSSTAYYALIAEPRSVAFNITMLLLCAGSMLWAVFSEYVYTSAQESPAF
ncbi:MAG: hypothetical protein HRT88_09290 [Lentisphaeraceae bacterium]|nr:hypothetical protein [Lentisphaeraceae bacterium]